MPASASFRGDEHVAAVVSARERAYRQQRRLRGGRLRRVHGRDRRAVGRRTPHVPHDQQLHRAASHGRGYEIITVEGVGSRDGFIPFRRRCTARSAGTAHSAPFRTTVVYGAHSSSCSAHDRERSPLSCRARCDSIERRCSQHRRTRSAQSTSFDHAPRRGDSRPGAGNLQEVGGCDRPGNVTGHGSARDR